MLTCFVILQFFTVLLSLDNQEELSPSGKGVKNMEDERNRYLNKMRGFVDLVVKRDSGDGIVGDLEAEAAAVLEASGKERNNVPYGARADEHARILQQVFDYSPHFKTNPLLVTQ